MEAILKLVANRVSLIIHKCWNNQESNKVKEEQLSQRNNEVIGGGFAV